MILLLCICLLLIVQGMSLSKMQKMLAQRSDMDTPPPAQTTPTNILGNQADPFATPTNQGTQ